MAFHYLSKKQLRFRKQKKTIKVFKGIGFKTTTDTGATICNFLDVTLDLTNNVFKPKKKKKAQKADKSVKILIILKLLKNLQAMIKIV